MNTKIIAALAVLIIVIAGVGVYAFTSSSSDDDTIEIAIVKHNFEPMYIADELGYFADEGVKVNLRIVGSGSESATALTTGEVDLAGFGPDPFLGIINNYGYNDYKWIGTYMLDDGVQGAASISSNIDLNNPATLKGKTVGINTTISYYSLFLEYLNAANENGISIEYQVTDINNIDPEKVNIIHTSNNALGQSLSEGVVDMIIGGAANAIVVEKNPDKFMYVDISDEHPEYKSYMPVGLMASTNTIEEKADSILKVMKALQRACEYIYNADGTINEDACNISIDALGNSWGLEVQEKYFTSAGWGFEFSQIDVNAMNTALKNLSSKFQNIGESVDPEKYYDSRFIDSLTKSGHL